MTGIIEKILVHGVERKQRGRGLAYRAFFFLFGGFYKRIYASYPDRKKIGQMFWGRKGGYEHAMEQFYKGEQEWERRYGPFREQVQKSLVAGMRIVEIGCSAGQWVVRLGIGGGRYEYMGIDINPESIEFARKQFRGSRGVDFQCCHVGDFVGIGSYDMVISCQTMFFLDDNTIGGLLRDMKTGGIVILQEPVNIDYDKQKGSMVLNDTNKRSIGISHNYPKLLQDIGFTIEVSERYLDKSDGKVMRLLIKAIRK